MKELKKALLVIFLINLFSISNISGAQTSYEDILKSIDNTLAEKKEYVNIKENKLKIIKDQLSKAISNDEKYTITKLLIDEYNTFDSDSAFHYIDKNIRLAKAEGNVMWINEMIIERLYVSAATSLHINIPDYISEIDTTTLPASLKQKYYRNIWFYYHHLNEYKQSEEDSIEYSYLCKSVHLTDRDDINYYYLSSHLADIDTTAVIKGLLASKARAPEESKEYAKISYELAKLFKSKKDTLNYINELSDAARADLKNANRETIALQELASYLYTMQNINRAYSYLQSSFDDARIYRAALRTIEISQILPQINEAYRQRHIIQTENLQHTLIGLIIIALFLLVSIIVILYQYKKIKRSREVINAAHEELRLQLIDITNTHEELNRSNARLQNLNNKLTDANYLKEEYIGYVFKICSAYIDKLEDLRKNISRNLKTRRYDEIVKICDSAAGSNDELKELYSYFDRIFLKIFPDFIGQVNALLYPDKQFVLKDDEYLNPELRILALIRLGINENQQIANFLHYSLQTVYNYLQKIRNKTELPKDEFLAAILEIHTRNKN